MALFSTAKKNTEESKAVAVPSLVVPAASVLIRPRITEKAAILSAHNAYAFEVVAGSTKAEVKAAIVAAYKVTPTDVRFVTIPAKNVFVRGKRGKKAGVRKAYVYLKKGDKIEII